MAIGRPRRKTWAWASMHGDSAARAAGATARAAAPAAKLRRRTVRILIAPAMASALPTLRRARTRRDVGFGRCLHLGHVLVALGGEPQRVVAELDRRILRRPLGRLAARQALDDRVVVGITEERHG